MSVSAHFEIEDLRPAPLSAVMAVEICGVDLSAPTGKNLVSALNEAFLDHLVLCVRGQRLTPSQFVGLSQVV